MGSTACWPPVALIRLRIFGMVAMPAARTSRAAAMPIRMVLRLTEITGRAEASAAMSMSGASVTGSMGVGGGAAAGVASETAAALRQRGAFGSATMVRASMSGFGAPRNRAKKPAFAGASASSRCAGSAAAALAARRAAAMKSVLAPAAGAAPGAGGRTRGAPDPGSSGRSLLTDGRAGAAGRAAAGAGRSETAGAAAGIRVFSTTGWQPVDTRTGRALSVPAALKAAADGGDPLAAYEMATRYLEGRGVAISATEAAKWYQRAADAGIAPAQYRLGSLYEKGTGVLRDYERARRLYERAGEAGNAKAMHNLAVMYAQGQATPRPDYKTAAQWFRRAAEHGVADSQYNLGILYARGLGVDQSLAESYKWFALAAAGGDQDAGKKRDEVAARLDPQTLVAARLAVQTFSARTEPDAAVKVAAQAEWADPPAAPAAQPARPAPRRAQSSR